jgi:hypothetical protein
MRMLAVHTAPLWQEANGQRTIGLEYRPNHPPVVGWCNTALIAIGHEARWFVLTR